MAITLQRSSIRFKPDPNRVIARFFMPGKADRIISIIEKVLDMSEETADSTLNQILRYFTARHRNITKEFETHFEEILSQITESTIDPHKIPYKKKLLIGSYFTMEYSIESAAFFNPSIVEDPYQGDLLPGEKRVIVSFRATGEGHISSIVFRSGILDNDHNFLFEERSSLVDQPEFVKRHVYEKKKFTKKLYEMQIMHDEIVEQVMKKLPDRFIYGDLKAQIVECSRKPGLSFTQKKVLEEINWLANAHYEITFSLDTAISERVIFPVSFSESNGIEDARFVRFVDDDDKVTYFATYTAYDGFTILPKMLKTKDFYHFQSMPINGHGAQNKGLALFPRKIKGKYAILSRMDDINNYVMFSDQVNYWDEAVKIQEPTYPWELVQVGNCGSPLETDEGWLVITHAVGPVRKYSLGAMLLDLDDPTQVIGCLKHPILTPNEEEREGYVPNVVYSCGSIIHNGELIVPYSMSDQASSFATLPLRALLDEIIHNGH